MADEEFYTPKLSDEELSYVDKLIEEVHKSITALSEELGISENCAAEILYYRSQPNYKKYWEDEMIARDKAKSSPVTFE